MSGSTEHRASKKPRASRRERILNLTTARKMLPLVERVVADILEGHRNVAALQPELYQLERRKSELTWPERRRRYLLQEEIDYRAKQVETTSRELKELGIALVDPQIGRVGFPTLVNNRPAYFGWWLGENDIRFWHFADEIKNRTIPLAWLQAEGITLAEQK